MCAKASPVRLAVAIVTPWYAQLPRNDLLLLRPTQRVVDVPGKFDGGVVRLGARVGEQHTAHAGGSDSDQPLGKLGADGGHLAREAVVERQLAHLPVGGVGEPPLGKAERRAPQPRHTFEVPPALVVVNVDTLTANNDQRPFRLHLPQLVAGWRWNVRSRRAAAVVRDIGELLGDHYGGASRLRLFPLGDDASIASRGVGISP